MRFARLILCLALSACAPPPASTLDRDGDGLSLADGDCDDFDSNVHPGAVEVCDEGDNDCDGLTDSADALDARAWYRDADRDGFGDRDQTVVACTIPPGHSSNAEDCDDSDPAVWPGAPEVWYDGVDQACDGGDDYDKDGDTYPLEQDCDDNRADVNPAAVETWYDGIDSNCSGGSDFDQDRDGWELAADCDDTDPDIHPGATDAWYDGIDANCDGAPDYDRDGDGVDRDLDCNDQDDQVYPGAVELCDSRRNDCSNTNWTVASETGTAVHTSPTGVLTRVGALLQGREGAPASYTVPAGTLALCHGTYYTQLSVTGSSAVAIVGVEGAGATTLNASRAGAVISTQANTNLTVSGVTISGGWQTFPNPGGNGGGISARGALVVRDSVFIGNGAVEGGAIYAEREATLSRLRIESSTGSAVRTHGDALLVDVDFINNLGRGFVPQGRFTAVRGGRFVGTRDVALTIDTSECILEVEGTTFTDHRSHTVAFVACPEATLDDVRIVDNVESTIVLHVRGGELTLRDSTIHGNGGRVHVQASRLDCEDSSITANGGITFGGVQVSADGTFFSRACDFGTSPADNNRPADVRVLVPSTSNFVDYHFGNNATFSCGLGSCIP